MAQEDDYRFARRRAQEGAADDAILRELATRGIDQELAAHVLRGVRNERKRWRGSVYALVVGSVLLVLCGGLLILDAAGALQQGSLPFSPRIAKVLAVVGGGLFVKGLFG